MSLWDELRLGPGELLPVVLQDRASLEVLMIAFMNREAVERTQATGLVHLWSRSRSELWLKGEISGRLLRVAELRPNCELSSLLVLVDQQLPGACHTGHSSCFYRRLSGGALEEMSPPLFDPASVYGRSVQEILPQLLGAYAWLRDQPAVEQSGTWRALQGGVEAVLARLRQEWDELLGVIDGTHSHSGYEQDIRLEAYQVLYWTALLHVLDGASEPFEAAAALAGGAADVEVRAAVDAALLLREPRERVLALWSALGSVLARAGVQPQGVIRRDLSELRGRDYMAAYFDHNAGASARG